jgi:glucosamine kinase
LSRSFRNLPESTVIGLSFHQQVLYRYYMISDPIQFGVDGGGTSCRAILLAKGQRVVGKAGPANASSDFGGATRTLHGLLSELAAQVGVTWRDLAQGRGYLGLAGIMSDQDGTRLAQALDLPRATVADDQNSTIVGALGDADGAVAAIGTGSFLGRQVDQTIRRIGGWGFHIGDQASGGWLGRRALAQVLLARDGLVEDTPLLQEIAAQDFGTGGMIPFQFRASPADYARLAPLILASSDPFARTLMQEGAAYIHAGLAALGWQPHEPLCLTGGIGPHYAPYLGLPVADALGAALEGAFTLAGRP